MHKYRITALCAIVLVIGFAACGGGAPAHTLIPAPVRADLDESSRFVFGEETRIVHEPDGRPLVIQLSRTASSSGDSCGCCAGGIGDGALGRAAWEEFDFPAEVLLAREQPRCVTRNLEVERPGQARCAGRPCP